MKNGWNPRAAKSAFVLAMAVVTSVSWGQVQRVQVGRALDANPLVGSGGSNQPISGYVPGQANGNDIISGNVAGLKYFHGNLHELTPYTFGAHLGSADLDAFARQSAGGIPTTPFAQPYFQPSTIVSTGQGTLYSAPGGNGFDSRIIPQSAVSPTTGQVSGAWIGGAIPVRTYGESAPVTFNGVMTPGRAIQSPLFSLRPNSDPLTGVPSMDGQVSGVPVSGLPALSPTATTTPPLGTVVRPGQANERNDQTQDNANGNNTDQASSNNGQLNNLPLNERVRTAINDSQRNGQPIDGRVQPTGPNELASNQNGEEGQVSDVYKQLSAQLDKAAGIETPAENGTGTNTPNAIASNNLPGQTNNQNGSTGTPGNPTNNQTAQNSNNTNGNPRTNGGTGRSWTDSATANPLNNNTDRTNGTNGLNGSSSGLNNSNGLTGTDNSQDTGAGGIRYQSTDPSLPGYRPRGLIMDRSAELQKQPDRVIKAGKKVDPLKSLAVVGGGDPHAKQMTAFDALMRQGEAELKDGRYLDAADAYQSALALQPNDPLALLGRGNAELAAGMFQSAAYDLKMVFANKPAMIGVRYSLQDYVPIERQDVLIKDLSEMSVVEEKGNLGSFLLCYLFYNTDRSKELDAELGRWGNRPWKDGWEPVAEKAWGK